MVKTIYALKSGQLVLYVGKTGNVKIRKSAHKTHKSKSCGSSDIPKDLEWTLEILEECSDASATCREQYYYDVLNPLFNRCRPGYTPVYNSFEGYMINQRTSFPERKEEDTVIYCGLKMSVSEFMQLKSRML
jgi:predicted GIY-YIG superfamily endonuclease